jgi:WD40 repeat protein
MTPSELAGSEDEYVALLAAAEEALTTSSDVSLTSQGPLPPAVRSELEADLACIEFLRRVLPQQADAEQDTLDQPPRAADDGAGAALPWTHLGRFQILRELGRGGFGVVYLANDPRLGRTVALKVPQGHALTDSGLRARFQREARAAAALEHGNLVPIYEAGEIGPVCFIASAYCPGPTLARWLKERDRPVPFSQAATLVAQLAEGVEHAHRNGVVHRDLKPGNVLLSPVDPVRGGPPDGRPASADSLGFVPRITDFGLARFMRAGEEAAQTRTDALVGTPAYMAPEQAGGQGRESGPATDVYALGAILYELLTGRPPFQAESVVDTLVLVRTEEPVRPARLRPRLPRDLETVCLRAMAKAPVRRYGSAGAMAADLRRWLNGEPILARPVGTWERAVKWARRRPAVAALVALTVLVAALGFAGVTSQWRRAEVTAAELQRRLYFYRIDKAAQETAANNMRLADELLNDCPVHLRGWEWTYVLRLRYGRRPALKGHSSAVHAVALHPNGRLLASASEDKTIRVWDLTTNEARPLGLHTDQVRAVMFSPDGRFLASAGLDGKVIAWSTDDWHMVPLTRSKSEPVHSIAFHPDGRRLAWCDRNDGSVQLGDIASGHLIPSRCVQPMRPGSDLTSIAFSGDGRRLAGARGNITAGDGEVVVWDMTSEEKLFAVSGPIGATSVAFSPDGRYLAAGGGTMWRGDGEVIVWDARTGREIHRMCSTSGMVLAVAFSPDSRRLATAGRDKMIKLWDVETGLEAFALHGHEDSVRALTFSRDGNLLVSGSADQTVHIWDATPLAATPRPEIDTLTGHAGRLSSVAYRPDGKCFATADLDGVIRIWDARTHLEIRKLPRHDGGVMCVAFNQDGRLLASTCDDGTVMLWDAQTWEELTSPPRHQGWILGAAFSPDDRLALSGAPRREGPGWPISLWDARAGNVLPTIHNAHTWFIQSIAFSPNGRWLASTGADGKVNVWDGTTGRPVESITPTFKGRGTCVAFSPDSQRLAYGGLNKTVTVLDTANWNELVVFGKHTNQVNSIAFRSDGRRVASASHDGTIKVWDAVTGDEIATLRGHTDWVESVAFRPDGEELISGSWDRTVKVWKAPP